MINKKILALFWSRKDFISLVIKQTIVIGCFENNIESKFSITEQYKSKQPKKFVDKN